MENQMKLFLMLIILAHTICLAATDVAFIEIRDYHNQIIQLEPNGRFAHVAISYNGQWLHAHPIRGVEIVSQKEIEKIGRFKSIVSLPDVNIETEKVRRFLGKHYDAGYEWTEQSVYCSELVGKLLELAPEPMSFKASLWANRYLHMRGQPGLSPDDVYRILIGRGYKEIPAQKQCLDMY
jgi:hypothetical protein